MSQILAKSSNIGAVTIGWKLLGKQRLLDWIYRFGFGKLTGIDFPGEVPGYVLPGDRWWSSTIGNVPMGQGISVTPIQMVAAYGAIANGGVMMKPYLTAQVGTRVIRPQAGRRIVTAKVAAELRSMLSDVVADGTGTEAQIPGYKVAGKTGTAQKALPNGGGYSKVNYVASFIGMVPAQRPAARGGRGRRRTPPLLGRDGRRAGLPADRQLRAAAAGDRPVTAARSDIIGRHERSRTRRRS